MVVDIAGVVKAVPVANAVPPVLAANHCAVNPDGRLTPNSTSPAPHLLPFTAVGAAGMAFTVATIGVLADIHPVEVSLEAT